MNTVLLYALLCGAFYYLGSRAVITDPLWRRYSPTLARFMDCPACTGFWYGLTLALVLGRYANLSYLGLDPRAIYTPFVVGFCSIVTTPLAAAILQRSLEVNGSALASEEDQDGSGR